MPNTKPKKTWKNCLSEPLPIIPALTFESVKDAIPDLEKKLKAVSAEYKNTALIQYFHQPMIVACQGNCKTAGSLNPSIDSEGGDIRLKSDKDFPNKFCVRNCNGCDSYDPRVSYESLINEVKEDTGN